VCSKGVELTNDFFKCIVCASTEADLTAEAWVCRSCHHTYPIQDGIPLLVRDWTQHQAEIVHAAQVRPAWYLQEQPPETVSPWRHHMKKRRLFVEETVQQQLKQRDLKRFENLLDLGCGDGNHLAYLRQYAETIYASDYNLVRLARSRQRFADVSFFLADILDYPARDGFFDLIFFNHVIEHIPNDLEALQAIWRILKTGGLLILGTPNEGVWWWQFAYRLQPKVLKASDHVHFYTADDLVAKIERSNLKVLDVKWMGWGPPHWSLDGTIRRFKWIDDVFEKVGQVVIPHQASSLYIIATK